MTSKFPALSIRQPWAELVLTGQKTVELRSWSTVYRGEFWLHTGLKGNPDLEAAFGFSDLFKGGYVGIVNLVALVPMDQSRWDLWRDRHLASGPYQPKMYAWILTDPHRFKEPIPGSGRLYLFSPSPEIEAQLLKTEFV